MLKPTDNLIEMLHNKQECIKVTAEFDRLSTSILRANVLNQSELAILNQVRIDFKRVQELENSIDKHLRKFWN